MIPCKNSRAPYIFVLLALLLISCEKPHPDVEEDIAIMEGGIPEPDTTTVVEECTYDSSYYTLTIAALRGIPDAKDIIWIESEHSALLNWRGNEVRRKRGGCRFFYDDLIFTTKDTTSLADTTYWLKQAYQVSKHFGIPYYPQAIAKREIELDQDRSTHVASIYSITPSETITEPRAFDGLLIARIGTSTRISFSQWLY